MRSGEVGGGRVEGSVVRSRWSLLDSRDIKDAWLLQGQRQHHHNALAILSNRPLSAAFNALCCCRRFLLFLNGEILSTRH